MVVVFCFNIMFSTIKNLQPNTRQNIYICLYVTLPLNSTILKLEIDTWFVLLSQVALDLMNSHSNTFASLIESHKGSTDSLWILKQP